MTDDIMKVWKLIIIILVAAFCIKTIAFKNDSKIYHGEGYTVEFPVGWIKMKEKGGEDKLSFKSIKEMFKKKKKAPVAPKGAKSKGEEEPEEKGPTPKVVTYFTPETNLFTEAHEASISILSMKLRAAAWIDDEFPEIVATIAQQGYKIMDRGQIKISEQIGRWVLYQDVQSDILFLEFYLITEGNMFYKIQYASFSNTFGKHRDAFEKSKATFKIKFGIK